MSSPSVPPPTNPPPPPPPEQAGVDIASDEALAKILQAEEDAAAAAASGGLSTPSRSGNLSVNTQNPSIPGNTENSIATLSSPWAYDESTNQCTNCHVQFTPINRKHHCRYCGKIFCHPCTDQRALIPPSSIVLVPKGGKKVSANEAAMRRQDQSISFSPDPDPDRMLTYLRNGPEQGGDGQGSSSESEVKELLYGKGLEERFKLAREPLRVCNSCYTQLLPVQEELRNCNSNAMRYNAIDPTDPRRLFNSPLAFTLGHEIRKAAYTLNNLLPLPKRMGALVQTSNNNPNVDDFGVPLGGPYGRGEMPCTTPQELQHCKEECSAVSPNLNNLDGVRIPARLVEQAKGVAVMTVVKGGFGLAGVEFGTGLVVARVGPNNQWSAPSAIGTAGLSWGALVGAQVSDHVFLLMDDAAVEMLFSDNGSVQLGADVGIAVGPLGRAAEADFGAASAGRVAPIYTYSQSKGLYAGVSLDGKVIVTRNNVNEKFYGRTVSSSEILRGAVPTPPAAQPLYEALARCHVYATGKNQLSRRPGTGASSTTNSSLGGASSLMIQQHQPPYPQGLPPIMTPPIEPPPPPPTAMQNAVLSEYGELEELQQQQFNGHQQRPLMPPAHGDQHSYAGMSDITSDPGY